VPERQDVNLLPREHQPVVEEVADPRQEESSHITQPFASSWRSDTRLPGDQVKRASKVFGERVRAGLPVLTPSIVGLFDLLGGLLPDDERQVPGRHRRKRSSRSAARTVSPRSTPAIASSNFRSSSGVVSKASVS
jgi:hypothetical protein